MGVLLYGLIVVALTMAVVMALKVGTEADRDDLKFEARWRERHDGDRR